MGHKDECNRYIRGEPVTTSKSGSSNVYSRKRRKFPRFGLPLVLSILLFAGTAGTIMSLIALTSATTNAFTMGTTQVEIVEQGVNPDSVPWGANAKPVQLRNPSGDNSAPGVVRAMIIPTLTDKATNEAIGGSLGVISQPSGGAVVMGDITLHFASDWESNWFYKDGFFYYKKVLNPGETTEKLLAGVTLDESKVADYADITVNIEVLSDILQITGSAPNDEWGVTVSGSNVSAS